MTDHMQNPFSAKDLLSEYEFLISKENAEADGPSFAYRERFVLNGGLQNCPAEHSSECLTLKRRMKALILSKSSRQDE